jgi:hypothetical protein
MRSACRSTGSSAAEASLSRQCDAVCDDRRSAAGGAPAAAACPGDLRSAFNNAWQSHAGRGPQRQEETAFRVAWAAVKKHYRKVGDAWVPKGW